MGYRVSHSALMVVRYLAGLFLIRPIFKQGDGEPQTSPRELGVLTPSQLRAELRKKEAL